MASGKAVAITIGAIILAGGITATQMNRKPSRPKVAIQQPQVAQPTTDATTKEWETRFFAVYGLKYGEVIKRIKPPFISEREEFCKSQRQMALGLNRIDSIIIGLNGKNVQMYAETHTAISRFSPQLYSLLSTLGIQKDEVQSSADLLQLNIHGDWVFDPTKSPDELLPALGKVIEKEFNRKIRFEQRIVPREVIIARGNFEFHPLPKDPSKNPPEKSSGIGPAKTVYFFAAPPEGNGSSGVTSGSTLDSLFASAKGYFRLPVINESNSANDKPLLPDNSPLLFVNHLNYHKVEPADIDLALQNLSRQTSLQFSKEMRQFPTWVVSE